MANGDDNKSTLPWPDVPHIVFTGGADWRMDARIDWIRREPDFGERYYLTAYRRAAELIYSEAEQGDLLQEYAFLPLAFLWRHVVEMQMKGIVIRGRQLLREDLLSTEERGLSRHNLAVLWELVKVHIADLGSPNAPEIANVESIVAQLQTVDPGADGFRYPLSRDRTDSNLHGLPEKVHLGEFHRAMVAIANFFDGCDSEIAAREEYVREMEGMERDLDRGGDN